MRSASVSTVLVAVMSAACVTKAPLDIPASTSTTGELSQLAGWLDFIHVRDGVARLKSVRPDGSTVAGSVSRENHFPAPGPGGLAIVSANGADRLVIADGSRLRNLGKPAGKIRRAALAFDGSYAVYESNAASFRDLYRADVATGQQRRLTRDGDGAFAPAVSPDSAAIAFVTTRSGNGDIHVIDADGGNRRALTHSRANDAAPNWSPDGKHIVFSSDRDGPERVFVVPASGGTTERLTNMSGKSRHEIDPSFSPTGRHIAYLVHGADSTSELWVATWPRGVGRRLSRTKGKAAHPAWSPDGRFVFYSDGDKHADIWAVDVRQGQRFQVTREPGDERLPRWRKARAR